MLLIGLTLLACEGAKTSYTGHSPDSYLPLNGERTWRYKNGEVGAEFSDDDIEINVETFSSEKVGDYEVVTLEYSVADPRQVLATIKWSSDSSNGIFIHGYSIAADGTAVDFETPVQVAETEMIPGDFTTSETDGLSFTATLEAMEDCPNHWYNGDDTWRCLHFSIEEASGASVPFTGNWWFASTYGTSRFEVSAGPLSSENPWVLSQSTFE